ncbi:MAG: hypothetical protein ACRBF0_01990 [Calditrichia bacterium]
MPPFHPSFIIRIPGLMKLTMPTSFGSPLDLNEDVLTFAGLKALAFDANGVLSAIYPTGSRFHGWSEKNRSDFNIHDHLLVPNDLSPDASLFDIAGYQNLRQLRWCSPDGIASDPKETLWRVEPPNGKPGSVVIFVQDRDPLDKKYYYQAKNLPGFFHNLNGPLGTIIGRAELLQHQHPDITGLEALIRVSNSLHQMVQNISSKVNNEGGHGIVPISLNRLLRDELEFLKADSFFKHQVKTTFELDRQVPQFESNYAAFTGVLAECYHLFRSHTERLNRYSMHVTSFYEGKHIGFSITINGDFFANGQPLPVKISANVDNIKQLSLARLDTGFLSSCMESHDGQLSLTCNEKAFSLHYTFPLPV